MFRLTGSCAVKCEGELSVVVSHLPLLVGSLLPLRSRFRHGVPISESLCDGPAMPALLPLSLPAKHHTMADEGRAWPPVGEVEHSQLHKRGSETPEAILNYLDILVKGTREKLTSSKKARATPGVFCNLHNRSLALQVRALVHGESTSSCRCAHWSQSSKKKN